MTQRDFQDDFEGQRKHIPEAKRILGEHLISEASFHEDCHHNTDLIVLTLGTIRIAMRLRTWTYALRYPDDFTIRSDRPSGAETELQKMLYGWGTHLFYGFRNEDDGCIAAWVIGDLNILRREYIKLRPRSDVQNHDGSSSFKVFRIDELPQEFIIARKSVAQFQAQTLLATI